MGKPGPGGHCHGREAQERRRAHHLHVLGVLVDVAVDGNGADAQRLGRAHDTAGNLAAVGHEDLGHEPGLAAAGAASAAAEAGGGGGEAADRGGAAGGAEDARPHERGESGRRGRQWCGAAGVRKGRDGRDGRERERERGKARGW